MHEGGTEDRPAVFFDDAEDFRAWLEANHETATELWMGLRKKHVDPRGLQWADAVREALCFGWIDSVAQRIDDDAVRQRWTPRKPGSNWSTININAVAGKHSQTNSLLITSKPQRLKNGATPMGETTTGRQGKK